LMFSERRISDTVQKCLNSAAANAENNDGISSEELYVTACYADEGPTMKRWRPRARGRATRIRKRTCHITIILARYTPDELEEMRNRAELKGASLGPSAAEARRRRVEKSKEVANDTESEAAQDLDEEVQEQGSSEERQEFADEGQENDEEQESSEENDESSPYGAGSAPAGDDGSQPSEDYQIKGKVSSKIYHPPESPFFSRTKADVWFTTSEVAEKAGFSLPASMQDSNEDDQPSSKNENEETGEDNETEEGE
jgi:large subunit ribosomal protein L22